MKNKVLLSFLIFIFFSSSWAGFFSYETPPLGWFWYRELKEGIKEAVREEPKEEKKVTEKKVRTEDIDAEYEKDPRWKDLPVVADAPHEVKKLLYKPTLENAKEYLRWLYRVTDRASVIADLIQRAVVESNVYPTTTPRSQYEAMIIALQRENEEKEKIKTATATVGLYYFYKPGCPACEAQNMIIQRLRKLGFSVIGIYIPGEGNPDIGIKYHPDRGMAKFFGITEVPSVVAVSDRTKSFRIIARGITTQDIIIERIFNFIEEEVLNGKKTG